MNNQQKKKNSGASWAVLVILIPLLMRTLDGGLPPGRLRRDRDRRGCAAIAFGKMAKNREKAAKNALESRGNGTKAAPGRKTPEVELHRPVPSMQRREPTAQRSFPQPDAYCVSCELSGEDHFVRDRQRRLQQLDEWLKNGLVDKQEYLVLKNRFEHDQ